MGQEQSEPRGALETIGRITTLIIIGAVFFYVLFVDALPDGGWTVLGYEIPGQAVERLQQWARWLLVLYVLFLIVFLPDKMSWGKWDE